MAAIQVRDVPPEIHAALRDRARAKERTIGQYVLDLIREDLQKPDDDEWRAAWEALDPIEGVDTASLIREGRDELDHHADRL